MNELKKYDAILINSYHEWIEVQKYLFKKGFEWPIGGKELLYLNEYTYTDVLIRLDHEKMHIRWRHHYRWR